MNRTCQILAIELLVTAMTGCVIVNPGEVRVSASRDPVEPSPGPAASAPPAYRHELERVIRREEKVLKKLQHQDWNDLLEETSRWTEEVRTLSGYAQTSPDPIRFQAYCDQLLAQIRNIRESALRQDPVACRTAIEGCDSPLNSLAREFSARGTAAVASPPSPPPPSARPATPPARATRPVRPQAP